MATNIEIKARAAHFSQQLELARQLADGPAQELVQEDVFFHCAKGRLKLRTFANGQAELIGYQRANQTGPKTSQYVRTPVADSATLRASLELTCGVRGVVRKKRTVFLIGSTRIHFDRVEGLGEFIELEVVMDSLTHPDDGERTANHIMKRLLIQPQDLIAEAYIDMLQAEDDASDLPSSKRQ